MNGAGCIPDINAASDTRLPAFPDHRKCMLQHAAVTKHSLSAVINIQGGALVSINDVQRVRASSPDATVSRVFHVHLFLQSFAHSGRKLYFVHTETK